MLYEELLGPWGRIVLVGIGCGAIFLALLLIVCFLVPGCLGYNCLKRQRKKVPALPQHQVDQQSGNIKLGDVSYRSWRVGSLYDNSSICENVETPRDSCASQYSEFEPHKNSSTLNLVDTGKARSAKKTKEFPTELTLSLQFLPSLEEPKNSLGKFIIGIEAVSGLPPKQYNCTVEPYVLVEVVKQQTWTHRRREVLHSFKTRGIRHTASPIYRETFVIADVNLHEAKDWTLSICANDHDRYANHTELCCLNVPLKEVKKIFASPEVHLFNYRMKPSYQEFGRILLGISYLPTAQRLTITVMKVQNLKYPPAVQSPTELNPYVRVLMLNGKTGRKLKKKKTRVLQPGNQFEFNETLTFELSFNQLDCVQFLVVLCNKVMTDDVSNIDHPSDSEDSANSFNKSKDLFIGKVALGKGVRGGTERLHWFSILQNPRKLVTVWHTLK